MATNAQTQTKAVDWSQFTPVAQAPVDWSQYTPVAEQVGPWQKYAAQQQAQADPQGPWTKYQRQPTAQAGNSDVNPYAQFVQAQPNPNAQFVQPTREQLSDAFYAARAAGNDDDARQIIRYIQHQGMTLAPMTSAQLDAAFQKQNAQNVASMTPLQRFMAGAGKSVEDTGRGVGELVGLESPQQVAQSRQMDQALVNSGAGKFGDYAGQAAQMYLGGLALRGVLGAAGVSSRLAPYINSAVTSGTFSGAQPVTPGESRALNTGVGTALGVVGQAVPGVLGGIANKFTPVMSQAKRAALDTAARYSIPLHLSQVANGRFTQALGAASRFLPFSGAAAADNAQRVAWNRALASMMGEDATELTPGVVANAKRVAGNDYTRVLGGSSIDMDGPTMNALAAAQAKAHAELLPENAALVDQQIDRVINAAADNGGAIPGAQYQDLRNSIKDSVRANPTLTHHLGAVRSALEDAANRQIHDLAPINARYKNIKTIEQGLKQTGGANNTITPANLYHLTQGKFGATPQMQALAQLGQTVLKSPINDSGTAQRWLAYRMLGAGGLGAAGYLDPDHSKYWLGTAGLLAGGPTVGRLMNSDLAARTLPYFGSNVFRGLSTAARPLPYMLPPAYTTQ